MSPCSEAMRSPMCAPYEDHSKMAQFPPTSLLPASLSAMVDSFNELMPGVPWNDSVLNAIKWEVGANAGCICFPIYVAHGDVGLELEMHHCGNDVQDTAKISIYWSFADDAVWGRTVPATKDGLLDLLLDTRRAIKCLRHGPCATCMARDPPRHNMRLTPEGGCVRCVLKTFLQS